MFVHVFRLFFLHYSRSQQNHIPQCPVQTSPSAQQKYSAVMDRSSIETNSAGDVRDLINIMNQKLASPSHPSSPPRPRILTFLDFPPAVRRQIYFDAGLLCGKVIKIQRRKGRSVGREIDDVQFTFTYDIIRTCKVVNEEVSAIVFAQNSFFLSQKGRRGPNAVLNYGPGFLRALSARLCSHLTDLTVVLRGTSKRRLAELASRSSPWSTPSAQTARDFNQDVVCPRIYSVPGRSLFLSPEAGLCDVCPSMADSSWGWPRRAVGAHLAVRLRARDFYYISFKVYIFSVEGVLAIFKAAIGIRYDFY